MAQLGERLTSNGKVPGSIPGSGRYFHLEAYCYINTIYLCTEVCMVRGYLPLISVYLRFQRNLSISNYSYYIKINGCCVGKINCVGGPGFETGSFGDVDVLATFNVNNVSGLLDWISTGPMWD